MKTPTLASPPRGFALVITLLLMIILTVATARGNARLALMMALGDLQKTIGPDRAVTANSAILVDTQKFNTTGVWESWWDFDPNSSPTPDYVAQKKDRFRRWLVSSPNPTDTQERDFAITPWTGQQITLVGGGSLGAGNTGPAQAVAGLVPVTAGKSKGAYAWHVADESIKARVNLYRDPTKNSTLAEKCALLAGHRPDPSVIKDTNTKLDFLPTDTISSNGAAENNFDKATKISQKITNLGQLDLVNTSGGSSTNNAEKIKPFRNDITPYSLGILTDVRNGGLKQDLSSVFEMSDPNSINLPSEFDGKQLYQSTLGLSSSSDPNWNTLAGYYNSFRNIETPNTNPTLSQIPKNDVSITDANPPKSFYPGPVIAKVETVFSFITRDPHSEWVDFLLAKDPRLIYMGHLICAPIITLYNPYNVNISFDNMEVTILNPPISFQFFVNDKKQNSQLVSLNELYYSGGENLNRSFVVTIGNWDSYTANTTSGQIIMKPGQTLVCGVYMDPTKTFDSNLASFDTERALNSSQVKAKPKLSLPCLGFDFDVLSPVKYDTPPAISSDNQERVLGLRTDDEVYMQFGMQKPSYDPEAELKVTANITCNGQLRKYGGLSFKYKGAGVDDGDTNIKKYFPNVFRYPKVGSFKAESAHEANSSMFKNYSNVKTVAIFSAYARTSNGGVDQTDKRVTDSTSTESLLDGRLAGKPFLFHNPASAVVSMDLTKSPSSYPYELNFQPLPGNTDNLFPIDSLNRGYAISGNQDRRGMKSASYLEIPVRPLQTLADFRRSNALSSYYLPQFSQPIGNSLLHPLMSPNKVIETNTSVASYSLLDHSFLANHALYDRFYFSTLATRSTSETPNLEFDKFMNLLDPNSITAKGPLLTQSYLPYLPAGKTVAFAKAELFSGSKPNNTAYQHAAEYQMIQGPFNVNSTNVSAWKAVLAAMGKCDVTTLWSKTAGLPNGLTTALATANTDKVPILGMSLPNGGGSSAAIDINKIDDQKTSSWNGYRELTPIELEILATKIVDQVRLRGPFLSMSEFVNRQIGPMSDFSLSGALEKAITDSEINKGFLEGAVTELLETDFADTALYNYKTPKATIGNPAAGAPGWVSQGDLLRILEPAATVRSDTFVIRVCGEAKDSSGNVTAKAYAEAVVQRVPEYVDPIDRPSLNAYDKTVPNNITSTASIINKAFGRRINIVSFRWLTSNEI
jgi:hypothetical protein